MTALVNDREGLQHGLLAVAMLVVGSSCSRESSAALGNLPRLPVTMDDVEQLISRRPSPPMITGDSDPDPVTAARDDEDPCRFHANGDYLCSDPVSTPQCGMAALLFSRDLIPELNERGWLSESEAEGRITFQATWRVVGPRRELVELVDEPPGWRATVDLSDVDAEIRVEPPHSAVARLTKSELLLIMSRHDKRFAASLAVHCHWPPRD